MDGPKVQSASRAKSDLPDSRLLPASARSPGHGSH